MKASEIHADVHQVREYLLTDEDFGALRSLAKAHTGIHLSDQKRELVYTRISRRLRALQLESFHDYRRVLSDPHSNELREFCNAITTNLTSFFREPHHFEFLAHRLSGAAAERASSRRLRFWCAGCSTGEEPYSLAIMIQEALGNFREWDVRILATDIDTDVLSAAAEGEYPEERLNGLGEDRFSRFFEEVGGSGKRVFRVVEPLRNMVTFKQLNLIHPLPMRGPFDAIFCRNVIIYFDKDTQRVLFTRMAQLQRSGDLLFLGHSESLFGVSDLYRLRGRTVYQRS